MDRNFTIAENLPLRVVRNGRINFASLQLAKVCQASCAMGVYALCQYDSEILSHV